MRLLNEDPATPPAGQVIYDDEGYPIKPDFNELFECGWGDIFCGFDAWWQGLLWDIIAGIGNFSKDMVLGAFHSTRVSDDAWAVVDSQNQFWLGIVLPLLLLVFLVELIINIAFANSQKILRSVLGLVAAVPFSLLAIWTVQRVSGIFGGITDLIFSNVSEDGQSALYGPAGVLLEQLVGSGRGQGLGIVFSGLLIGIITAIGALFLSIGMTINSVGLILASAMAPLGLMFIGQATFRPMAVKWFQLVLAFLLAEPVAAGIIGVGGFLVTSVDDSMFIFIAGAVVMFIAAFSPMITMQFVSFVGQGMESTAGPGATRVMQNVKNVNVMKGVKFGKRSKS